MYRCPHCGQPGISWLRKMCLGPPIPATCKACGRKVGVPYTAMVALVPLLIAIAALSFVDSWAAKAVIWIAGVVAMSAIHMLWIPLQPR